MFAAQGEYALLSVNQGADKFGFFKYAEEISPPKPPHPLRRIFSIMRALQCRFLVEEALETSGLPRELEMCSREVELLSELYGYAIGRKVRRITFFRTPPPPEIPPSGVERWFEDSEKALRFPTQRRDASKQKEACLGRLEAFLADENALECLGFLYLFIDYREDGERPIISTYVPRAVVSAGAMKRRYPALFIHSAASFSTTVLGCQFGVEGSLFAQQEGRLWCCAHAALTVALENIFTARGLACPVGYPDVNEYLGIDHFSRLALSGLRPKEVCRFFEHPKVGWRAETLASADRGGHTADDVLTAAYHAIETGLPAIICFQGDSRAHAMAAVGHTFDENLWSARATPTYFNSRALGYTPSHTWVDSLVVQDDNVGPYCTLPRRFLRDRHPSVIVPRYPWAPSADMVRIETQATELLTKPQFGESGDRTLFQNLRSQRWWESVSKSYWLNKLRLGIAEHTCVIRTTPCAQAEYMRFITSNQIVKDDPALLEDVRSSLNPWGNEGGTCPFWLVELSIPELYQTNTRRLGEVIVHETCSGSMRVSVIRLPGVLTLFSADDRCRHFRVGGEYHYEIARRGPEDLKTVLAGVCDAT